MYMYVCVSHTFQMPPLPITLTAQILALLLVFRTNSSYARWDEARKMWGSGKKQKNRLAYALITRLFPPLAFVYTKTSILD